MSTRFYIKEGDTSDKLKVVIRKKQAAADGIVPSDEFWTSGNYEQQRIVFSAVPLSGSWTLTLDGQTTNLMPYNITAQQIEYQLQALSNIGTGNVKVSGSYDSSFLLSFNPSLNDVDLLTSNVSSLLSSEARIDIVHETTAQGATPINEIQSIRMAKEAVTGKYLITIDSLPTSDLPYNVSAANMESAIKATNPAKYDGNVVVTGTYIDGYLVEFDYTAIPTGLMSVTLDPFLPVQDIDAVDVTFFLSTEQDGVASGIEEVQKIKFSAVPISGDWNLIVNDITSQPIPWDASPLNDFVKNEIETILGETVVSVVGTYVGGELTVIFEDSSGNIALMSSISDVLKAQGGTITTNHLEIKAGDDPNISLVRFSMKKIPQIQEDGTILNPDGTITQTDGTIVNPTDNVLRVVRGITLDAGETLAADFTITQVNLAKRYANGIVEFTSSMIEDDRRVNGVLYPLGTSWLPLGEDDLGNPIYTLLLPNGMLKLPPNDSYPQGYIYNPTDQDRDNYYRVGNPTDRDPEPDGTIPLPDGCYIDMDPLSLTYGALNLPAVNLRMADGVTWVSGTTISFPTGTTKEESADINRDNAIVLPKEIKTYEKSKYVGRVFTSNTHYIYEFVAGTVLAYDHEARSATITFFDASTLEVPYETIDFGDEKFIFPCGTEHFIEDPDVNTNKFKFPQPVITIPTDAILTVGPAPDYEVTVQFPEETEIYVDADDLVASFNDPVHHVILYRKIGLEKSPIRNYLVVGDIDTTDEPANTGGNVHLFDESVIKVNNNDIVIYNGYRFYQRGTQKKGDGTIIHPDCSVETAPSSDVFQYHPTKLYHGGLLVRADGAIINNNGTYTRLDTAIVNENGQLVQPVNTQIPYFEEDATIDPPFTPSQEYSFVPVNKQTGSYDTFKYDVDTIEKSGVVLEYQWQNVVGVQEDTAIIGLYSGEFEVAFDDGSVRTFPVLKDDVLLIEILKHFSEPSVEV